ncbi:DUF4394 domain-containing protein [Sulfitobacter sp. D35]|uniref:DUF4394 domain-containing protein n=1 Tax=Sulfitobacter sp. D35 TaxID=3083252 RepID=UPI00296F537E|nr:DUF4394 domain-containing protein [Sulfitobacter sp. D35]MDW4496785.1 DUF4394 domain-containing protein [Sulfitobacter sp. D35]
MHLRLTIAAFLAVSATQTMAATVAGTQGYGLAAGGTKLVRFDSLADLGTSQTIDLSGQVSAIAYRPVTGELYGYVNGKGSNPDDIVLIDRDTGMLTSTGVSFTSGTGIGNTAEIGFDFNNQIDAERAVSTDDDNLVFFPSDFSDPARQNTVDAFADLFYAAGDINDGRDPMVFANAYTNAIDGEKASSTLQYAIDAETDSLINLDNNNGTLITVGLLGLNVSSLGGFEIVSTKKGGDLALALLRVQGGGAGLYEINLGTGTASLLGDPGRSDFIGFAAQNAPTPVPLPASVLLLGAGVAGLGLMRRRRKSA